MQQTLKLPRLYLPGKLKTLPLREQPVARVAANPAACGLLELLAAVVGGPQQIEIAEALLERFNGDVRRLYQAHVVELAAVHGVGQQTAARLKAALALGNRLQAPAEERVVINCPADAAELLLYEMSLLQQEVLKVLLLDTRNRVLEIVPIYHGSVNSAQVRVAELFKPAVQRNAPSLILAHNHPSGDPTPSPDDTTLTRAVVQAGKLLDITCLDHLVIGGQRFVSLKERGLGFQ